MLPASPGGLTDKAGLPSSLQPPEPGFHPGGAGALDPESPALSFSLCSETPGKPDILAFVFLSYKFVIIISEVPFRSAVHLQFYDSQV